MKQSAAMPTHKYAFIFIIMSSLCPFTLQAQKERVLKHQLEASLGVGFISPSGSSYPADYLSPNNNASFNVNLIRYSFFFFPSWGVYAGAGFQIGSTRAFSYDNLITPFEKDYDIVDYYDTWYSNNSITGSLGLQYRTGKDKFFLRARAGFSADTFPFKEVNIQLQEKGTDEKCEIIIATDIDDYPDKGSSDLFHPNLELGINLDYKIYRALALTCEIGYIQSLYRDKIYTLKRNTRTKEVTQMSISRTQHPRNKWSISLGMSVLLYKTKKRQ